MHMITIDYNAVRFNLTEVIRHLDSLKDFMQTKNRPEKYISEIEYWLSSLDLLRNCLYGCKDRYDGQLDLYASIKEIKSEITNFIVVVKDFKIQELKRLDTIWSLLVKIEKLLKET